MATSNARLSNRVESFRDRFVAWAEAERDVRAVIQVGDWEAPDGDGRAWSDVDLIIATTQPQRRLAETDWLSRLGQPVITFIESAGLGDESQRRVVFEDGVDVDLVPITMARLKHWVDMGMAEDLSAVFGRGYRVLVDKEAVTPRFAHAEAPASGRAALPGRVDYLETVRDFWYQAGRTGKLIARGDLWTARACCDVYMKRLLLRMLAWQAKARHGGEKASWYEGRNLERWADPDVLAALRDTFARYERADIVRALFATMTLFGEAARESGDAFGFRYLAEAEKAATATIEASL